MHCVNHPGVEAKSFCQNCGKALCTNCIRTTAAGQILCDQCFMATGGDPSAAYWQAAAQNFAAPPQGTPNPGTAAVLGLIPGVGAMYNGQLFKGLIHVVVFAVLVSITDHYMIFLIFVFAWCLYQSFEAFHTAKARRDGVPLPDPFGLNELGNWLNLGSTSRGFGIHHGGPSTPPPPSEQTGYQPAPGAAPNAPSGTIGSPSGMPGSETAVPPPPYSAPYGSAWGSGYPPQAAPYSEPYAGPNPGPYAGDFPPGVMPPVPPVPPAPFNGRFGRGREPVGAFILIGLGLIFMLQTMGFVGHAIRYAWPLMLIGFGIWLFIRRAGYKQGGSK